MKVSWWPGRDRVAVLAALAAPLAAAACLIPFRGGFTRTDGALVLVVVVVAVAANGYRVAGVVAALSAAAWFDFFLTRPYERFTIASRADVETTVLLLAVGIGVTELALWGRRQHALAREQAGYLAGIQAAASAVAVGAPARKLTAEVADQLTRLLTLTRCRYQPGVAGLGRPARLLHDGSVVRGKRDDGAVRGNGGGSGRGGIVVDVDAVGLPVDEDIELIVESGGRLAGRFLLTAAPRARPTVARRLVAVALADQVGAAFREHGPSAA
jgi:hypothetical protein